MTATSGKQLPIGLRYAAVFALDSNGYPAAESAATPYEGLSWSGPKAFTLAAPQARKISHVGADRVLATDFLPPLEGMSGELRVADHRFDIHALLTNTNELTVGEAKEIAHGTSKQGNEPTVMLMLYQQAVDLVSGLRRWRTFIIPRALIYTSPAGMTENNEDVVYQVAPMVTTKRGWGAALAADTDGYISAQAFEYMTEGRPNLITFQGDASATEFSFPSGLNALNTSKVTVFKNGVEVTAGITVAVDSVTFSVAPADGDMIVIFYELE